MSIKYFEVVNSFKQEFEHGRTIDKGHETRAVSSAMSQQVFKSGVIEGNCELVLPTLPGGIAQVVFLDPPYNLGFDYGEGRAADRLPPDVYLAGIQRVIRLSIDRLTDNGSIWVLSPERWADPIGTMLSNMLPRRNRIICRETFGQYHEHCFPNGHRHLFWHVKDEHRSPFHTEGLRVPSRRMEAGDKRAKGPRVPDDVWEIARLVGNARERVGSHPCQLPEELVRRVVLCSTAPGDLVIDPMAGTGTTLRVAQALGRRYLGIEKSGPFVELIRQRLRESYQTVLFS